MKPRDMGTRPTKMAQSVRNLLILVEDLGNISKHFCSVHSGYFFPTIFLQCQVFELYETAANRYTQITEEKTWAIGDVSCHQCWWVTLDKFTFRTQLASGKITATTDGALHCFICTHRSTFWCISRLWSSLWIPCSCYRWEDEGVVLLPAVEFNGRGKGGGGW